MTLTDTVLVHHNCPNCNKEISLWIHPNDKDATQYKDSVAFFQCCAPYEDPEPNFLCY